MNEPTSRSTAETFGAVEASNYGDDVFDDVSTTVVIAIAEAKGVDPISLEYTLNEWIDPDALDSFVESMSDGHVAFDVENHRVRVDADGTVALESDG